MSIIIKTLESIKFICLILFLILFFLLLPHVHKISFNIGIDVINQSNRTILESDKGFCNAIQSDIYDYENNIMRIDKLTENIKELYLEECK